MKTRVLFIFFSALLLASCGEYNKILKSKDPEVKYEYAKKYYDLKKYSRTYTLLEEILPVYTGSSKEQEILFLIGQAYFASKDYTSATMFYTRYYNKFPKGEYTEIARFYAPKGYYLDSPDARLDQSMSIKAIQGYQDFLEFYPKSEKSKEAQDNMFELQEKLAYKEFLAAHLYFNLGLYMGNNYESCVVTAREALKSYPFSTYAEEMQFLIVKSRFELAYHSIDDKKPVRYRDVVDEYFNYKNTFPEGKYSKDVERFYREALKIVGDEIDKATYEAVQENKEKSEKSNIQK